MIWYRFGECAKCRGDLALDDGDWMCLQCGTYFYTGLYELEGGGYKGGGETTGVEILATPIPSYSFSSSGTPG